MTEATDKYLGKDIDEIVRMVPGILATDSKNVYDSLLKNAPYMGMTEKMAGLELQGTAQLIGARQLECRW
eukprot:6769850-Alexandrium_andersonii.AAC.1